MVDLSSLWASNGRPLGRTELVLEAESTCAVVILEFICRCDDITVQLGSQTLAVIDRRRFTTWLWHSGSLHVDDVAFSAEGNAVFAVLNGGRRYLFEPGSLEKLAELIANSG